MASNQFQLPTGVNRSSQIETPSFPDPRDVFFDSVRPGLRKIRELATKCEAYGETSGFVGETAATQRIAIYSALGDYSSQVWNLMQPWIFTEKVSFLGRRVAQPRHIDGVPRITIAGNEFPLLNLDPTFGRYFNATTFSGIAVALKATVAEFNNFFVDHWYQTRITDAQALAVDTALEHRKFNAADVLRQGFNFGAFFTINTLAVLVDKYIQTFGIQALTPAIASKMTAAHASFVLSVSQLNFSALLGLQEVLRAPAPDGARKVLMELMGIANKKEMETAAKSIRMKDESYKSRLFSLNIIEDGCPGGLPVLDFCWEGFTRDELSLLARPDKKAGCPASRVNGRYVPLLCEIFNRTAVAAITENENDAYSNFRPALPFHTVENEYFARRLKGEDLELPSLDLIQIDYPVSARHITAAVDSSVHGRKPHFIRRTEIDPSSILLPEASLENPYPGLSKLRELMKERNIADSEDPHQMAQLNPAFQTIVKVRLQTQAALGGFASEIWSEMRKFAEQGKIAIMLLPEMPRGERIWEIIPKVNGDEIAMLELDKDFRKYFGARNLGQIVTMLKLSHVLCLTHYLDRWKIRSVGNQDLIEADRLMNVKGFSSFQALSHGFGSAYMYSINTLTHLTDMFLKQGGSLSWKTAQKMTEQHAQFILRTSKMSLTALIGLMDALSAEPTQAIRNFLGQWAGESTAGLSILEITKGNAAIDKLYKPSRFKLSILDDGTPEGLPVLDLNLPAFTRYELAKIIQPSKAIGCPAGDVNVEYVPWLCRSFASTALAPLCSK